LQYAFFVGDHDKLYELIQNSETWIIMYVFLTIQLLCNTIILRRVHRVCAARSGEVGARLHGKFLPIFGSTEQV